MLPLASVVNVPPLLYPAEVQLKLASLMPPENVEVAVEVLRMEPPVIVSPEAEERPPVVETEIPPENVEVAVEVALMDAT